MNEFWGVTILLFIVLTVLAAIMIRIMSYYREYHLVRHERALLSGRTLKSGDIILFVAHTHGLTNSLFTWDLFSHAGVVVEIEGGLWLSESTVDSLPDAQGEEEILPQGSQLNRLLRRLKHYPGMAFHMPLEKPLTPSQEETLVARAREWVPYPSMLQMLGAVFRIPVHRWARHCMQHVAWLLDELGLAPGELAERGRTLLSTGFFGSSRAVSGLSGKPLGGGANRYGDIVELLYDLDAF